MLVGDKVKLSKIFHKILMKTWKHTRIFKGLTLLCFFEMNGIF